ncbi:MAG: glycosyltransferase family 39 protein [Parafilimonas sp.]|nr:glycosyltransferase family 39 protein [Parafilimonas sp.]
MNLQNDSYKKKVLFLIAAIGIFRLILAFTIELGNDESYYWLYSQHLKSNYFDHPPMIALWIRATTLNLWLQNYPGFIRLSSVLSCCIASWFMYKCVAQLKNERAGFIAACLYNASFYAGVTAGIFVMPDSPQMVFWTCSLYMLALVSQNETSWKYWLCFGITSGLCIMSKLHGLYIWIGFGCFILFYKRKWLLNIKIYTALAISITICLPILLWNIKYNFITYKFDGPRINIEGATHNWQYLFNEILGQIFINNPVNFVLIILGLFALRKRSLQRLPALIIFNFTGLFLALTLLVISVYRQTLPHWSGPAYVSLLPLAAVYLEKKVANSLMAKSALALHIFTLIILSFAIYYYPGNFGITSGKFIGYSDMSLDWYGWKQSGEKFDSIYSDYKQKNITPQNTPVICDKWWGAHIEYYFCRPLNIKLIGLGNIMNLHEYEWMNAIREDSVNMQQAFCIVPSDEYYDAKKMYNAYYNSIDSIATVKTFRGNKPAHDFYIYHLSGWKGIVPIMR